MAPCTCFVTFLLQLCAIAYGTHLRSALIQWKPVNSNSIEILQRFSWRESFFGEDLCNDSTALLAEGPIRCLQGCNGNLGNTAIYCTDFSLIEDWFSGTRIYNYTFDTSSLVFEASYRDCCWISTLVIGADGSWEVTVRGNRALRPDGKINSSPITSSAPILRLQHGCHYVYKIPVEDPNGDIVKCRWASSALGECGGVCNAFPNAILNEENCTITYTANSTIGAYAVAIQVEDYLTTSSTTPLSSVPLQFLVNVSVSDLPCAAKPILVHPTPPDQSCIAVPLDTTYTSSIVAYSPNISINNFETVSPRGFHRTPSIGKSSYNMSLYYINITWIPKLEQFGLNILCFTAENTARVASDQSCITLVVGIAGPRILKNSLTPSGFASPSPTTVWRIEFDQPVGQPQFPKRLSIYEEGNEVPVFRVSSEDAIFPPAGSNGTLVTFSVDYPFDAGKKYYVLVDAGFAVGEQFCKQESLEVYNKTFWTFEIPGIKLSPRFGNSLGGTAVMIDLGTEISPSESIGCAFAEQTKVGRRVGSSSAICVSPPLQNTNGFVDFKLDIGDRRTYESKFLSISPEVGHAVNIDGEDSTTLIIKGKQYVLRWDPNSLVPNGMDSNINVDISYQVMYYDSFSTNTKYAFQPAQPIRMNTANNGEIVILIDDGLAVSCLYFGGIPIFGVIPKVFNVCPMFIKISVSEGQTLPSDINIWSGTLFLRGEIDSTTATSQCNEWQANPQPDARLQQLLRCPPNELVASFDVKFVKQDMTSAVTSSEEYQKIFMNFFHHGINECYRQSSPDNNFGQQCCYGNNSILVKGMLSGGSADASSPFSNYYEHVIRDLLPYVICCKVSEFLCDAYYQKRPSGSEEGYRFPRPASALGDPHIVTLDGLKYTFNGKGEFTLIQTEGNTFTLQGRMEQITDNNGNLAPGTVFTAIVARQLSPSAIVQFEVVQSDGSLRTLVNSEEVTFRDITTLKFEGVALLQKANNSVLAWFSMGSYVEVRVMNSIIEVLMVGLPESMKRKTKGLMGSFNDIMSDDLVPKGGQLPIPTDSSLERIHNEFGKTWIIRVGSDSLFTYRRGENHATFYFPNFSPMFGTTFTNSTLEVEAKKICGDDVFCLFDIAATGRVEIGTATMEEVKMIETVDEMTKPIICEPPCENGVCTEDNSCSCNLGYTGDRCDSPIIEECPENLCQNNGTCSRQGGTYYCACISEFTGTFCQDRVPPLRIQMLNSSPQVLGNMVLIWFSTNKPADVKCYLDGNQSDCNGGSITYNDVSPGKHTLRIVAHSANKERALIRRRIYIGNCAVHLINDGISINDGEVVVQFSGTEDATHYYCGMDGSKAEFCRSPLRYDTLEAGRHTLIIEPRGCKKPKKGRLNLKFTI